MTDADTAEAVTVEGDVFLPTTEPILSVVAEDDEAVVETDSETVSGVVDEKEYVHESPDDLPGGVTAESAYRVTLRETGEGKRQLVQGARSNVLYVVGADGRVEPADTIRIGRE